MLLNFLHESSSLCAAPLAFHFFEVKVDPPPLPLGQLEEIPPILDSSLLLTSAELHKAHILVEHGEGPVTMNAFQEMFANLQQQLTEQHQQLTQVQTQLTEQNQQMTQQNQQLAQQIQEQTAQQLTQQNQEIQSLLLPLSTRLDNFAIKRINLQAISSTMQDRSTHRLRPLYKIHEGFGEGFPNHQIPEFPPAVVGDPAPPHLFPQTIGEMEDLPHKKLSDLSVWFNDDFDIVQEDLIKARCFKFQSFIS